MIVAIGADHAGFTLKAVLIEQLKRTGHVPLDRGAFSARSSDYPDLALAVAESLRGQKAERGLLVCGSGVGACVAANKFPGIRACVCHDTFSARQGVEDDDMNVLCLGARVIGPEIAKELARTFLTARFSAAERHVRRLSKVAMIEKEFLR